MKFLNTFVTLVLIASLMGASFLLWTKYNQEVVKLEMFTANISRDLPLQSEQFYQNMRYQDSIITFNLSKDCETEKRKAILEATATLEAKTILKFRESNNAQISILCSDISPKPEQKNHFIAGEGGPTEIINTSKYAIILSGKISLYRQESCDTPQIATHELLHALGFNHNSNEESIMFPLTNCDQTIDAQIINDINILYSIPSKTDLAIEKAEANMTGRYLSFLVTISNQGLKNAQPSFLKIIVNNEEIKSFNISSIDLGAKRHLTVTNLRVPRKTSEITFKSETAQKEISKSNNEITIRVLSA